jgi:hypothetical protein
VAHTRSGPQPAWPSSGPSGIEHELPTAAGSSGRGMQCEPLHEPSSLGSNGAQYSCMATQSDMKRSQR